MSEVRLERNLSLLPWTNTREALSYLQELLKCSDCQQLPISPQYMGRCDHFFCEPCIEKLTDNFCPVCKIPSLPCERKPDIIVRGLVYSAKEMFDLINGGEVPVRNCSLEAPDPFCHSNKPLNNNVISVLNTRSATNKENMLGTSTTDSVFVAHNHPPTANDNVRKAKTARGAIFQKSRPKPKGSKPHELKKNMKITQANANNNNKINRTLPMNSKSKQANSSFNLENTKGTTLKANSSFTKVQDLSVLGIVSSSPAFNKRNIKGETPLHTSCIKGDVSKVKGLLEEGANPNTRDNAGWTPLHEACSHGFEDIANLLLEHGALVDVPGSCNMMPLHDAVLTEALPIVTLLRRWDASDSRRDIWGRTARSLADSAKSPEKVHSALDTPKDELLIPKSTFGPLQNKIAILDSNLSTDHKKKFERLSKLLKLKAVNEFSADVTHIVVGCNENKKVCSRTMKYMMGVVSGKWIVCHEWIDACLTRCGPVDPADYEVEGPLSNPCCLAPNKGRVSASKMMPGLFSGCHIFFYGPFGESLPTKKEMEALVKAGDGIPLQREPDPESIDELEQTVPFHAEADGPLAKCSHFCIYVEGPNEPQLKYDMAHIKSFSLSWLYDCIDQWCLASPVK